MSEFKDTYSPTSLWAMNDFKVVDVLGGRKVGVLCRCAYINNIDFYITKEKFKLLSDDLGIGNNADSIFFELVRIAYPKEEEEK